MIILSLALGLITVLILLRRRTVPAQYIMLSLMLTSIMGLYCALGTTLLFAKEKTIALNGAGGALGMVAGLYIFCLILPKYSEVMQEAYIAALPLMYGVSKIGCSYAGCCFGLPYSGHFSVIYGDGVSRIPIQIMETVVFILIFLIGLSFIFTGRFKPAVFAGVFALVKLLMDFLRDSHAVDFITLNQIICLITVGIVIVANVVLKRMKQKTN